MKRFNINSKLIEYIQHLYNKAESAVYFDGQIEEWFRKTTGVRQGCLLSPTLFNILLEQITNDALDQGFLNFLSHGPFSNYTYMAKKIRRNNVYFNNNDKTK